MAHTPQIAPLSLVGEYTLGFLGANASLQGPGSEATPSLSAVAREVGSLVQGQLEEELQGDHGGSPGGTQGSGGGEELDCVTEFPTTTWPKASDLDFWA